MGFFFEASCTVASLPIYMELVNDGNDIIVPAFYVIKRGVQPEEMAIVLRVLNITPCHLAIVSDLHDSDFAFALCPQVLHAVSDDAARGLALKISIETGKTALVVGESSFITAVYPNLKEFSLVSEA